MSVGQRRMRVGISGSYGGFNLGDEAILTAILQELRGSLPVEVTVFSRDPDDTLVRHGVDHALHLRSVSLRDTRAVISGLDLFILGGGGILYDEDADMFLRGVNLAHEVGTPVMVYAISAGPLMERPVRSRVRAALQQAAAITVRDRHTQRLLEELGITQQVLLTADPAVLLRAEPLTWEEIVRSEAINPGARLIAISVREPGPAAPELRVEHYHRLVANAADFMIDRFDAEVVFFPLERRTSDVQHSHGVVGQMSHAQRATVLKRDYTPGQLVSLLEHFEFAVGMRLHFLIFSALAGVPFTALPYATKVSGFLEELQLRTPELSEVSAGQLIAIIDRAWDQRELLQASLSTALVDLQRRARRNNQIAVQLLTLSTAPQLQEQPGA